jgi:hypothetical protein
MARKAGGRAWIQWKDDSVIYLMLLRGKHVGVRNGVRDGVRAGVRDGVRNRVRNRVRIDLHAGVRRGNDTGRLHNWISLLS